MKIIIIGASGTIGKKVTRALWAKNQHEIVTVGLKSGDYQVDIGSRESIIQLFKDIGSFDSLISITGAAHLGPLTELKEEDLMIGIKSKLLGQINLVLLGMPYINPSGSFTLTSGILAEDPILQGTACTVADAGVNAFVQSASIELKNDVRLNAIAPGVVEDSPALHQFFPGHIPVAMELVTAAYLKSVLGGQNGAIFRAY